MAAAVLLPTGIHAEESLSPGISGPTATVKSCFQGSALAGSYLPFNKKIIVTRASQEPKWWDLAWGLGFGLCSVLCVSTIQGPWASVVLYDLH